MWKKRLGQWNTKDRKAPAIGKPRLLETTIEENLLSRLPTIGQAQARGYETQNLDQYLGQSRAVDKELPPLDLSVSPSENLHIPLTFTSQMTDDEPNWRASESRPISDMPSSSSIYTRSTPEMRHDFDPSSRVAPLFSDRPKYESQDINVRSFTGQQGLANSESNSTLMPSYVERAKQAGAGRLGVSTIRQPWHGASGETTLMTPIASTPAATGSSRSVGTVSPIDETMSEQQYVPSDDGARAYPSPQSMKDGDFRANALQPSADFRTPTQASQDMDDGWSIGYDVSPWSTPSSRPYYGSILDGSTPGRTPSSRRPRRSMSSGRQYGYRRQNGSAKRPSMSTRRASDDGTVFEISEPGTTQPSFNVWANGTGAHAVRSPDPNPVTPPMQQGGFREPTAAPSQSDIGPNNNNKAPQVSRFSWTTQATETTYPGHDDTPNHNPASPSTKFFDSPWNPANPSTTRNAAIRAEETPTVVETPPSPVMNRRRPIGTSPHLDSEREHPAFARKPNDTKPFIKRKPTPSSASTILTTATTPDPADKEKEKALPTTPSELSTHDYITELSAQLESFRNRKHNLSKMIKASESVSFGPTANPMVIDLEKRRETKERVRCIEAELSEVRRWEHETGLKLMRAEKRRDQEGPTALWVRRVTG